MPTYQLKLFRRTCPGGTTGELLSRREIEAPGMAHAEQMLRQDLKKIDFKTDFAILEGDTGFVTCWLKEYPDAPRT